MCHFLVKEKPKASISVSWKTLLLNRERYFGSLSAVLGRNDQSRTFTKSDLFLLLILIIPPLSSMNLCQYLSQFYLTHEVLTEEQQLHFRLRGLPGKSVLFEIIHAKFFLRDFMKWSWVYVCHHGDGREQHSHFWEVWCSKTVSDSGSILKNVKYQLKCQMHYPK